MMYSGLLLVLIATFGNCGLKDSRISGKVIKAQDYRIAEEVIKDQNYKIAEEVVKDQNYKIAEEVVKDQNYKIAEEVVKGQEYKIAVKIIKNQNLRIGGKIIIDQKSKIVKEIKDQNSGIAKELEKNQDLKTPGEVIKNSDSKTSRKMIEDQDSRIAEEIRKDPNTWLTTEPWSSSGSGDDDDTGRQDILDVEPRNEEEGSSSSIWNPGEYTGYPGDVPQDIDTSDKEVYIFSSRPPIKVENRQKKVEIDDAGSGSGNGETSPTTPAEEFYKKTTTISWNVTFECPQGMFRCGKNCLEMNRVCDSRVDCFKAEDEVECSCASRLPKQKLCDGLEDCADGSDERNCTYCRGLQFNCGDWQCIVQHEICDSKMDCHNGMDEQSCFRVSPNLKSGSSTKGFLMRNVRGIWYPYCNLGQELHLEEIIAEACYEVTLDNEDLIQWHSVLDWEMNYKGMFAYSIEGRFGVVSTCDRGAVLWLKCGSVRCGRWRDMMGYGRVVGGLDAMPGQWPWHAALYRDGRYHCGATLISERWLITAAHCMLGSDRYYYEISLGTTRLNSPSASREIIPVLNTAIHPKFSARNLKYDVALLRLSWKPQITRPSICLPTGSTNRQACVVVGWGETGRGWAEHLQAAPLGPAWYCGKGRLCAGDKGKDACRGDSGGALACASPVGWQLAGVVSGGSADCGKLGTPGIYSAVADFLPWMHRTVQQTNNPSSTLPCPGLHCPTLGCLPSTQICDGTVNCPDASDETPCKTKWKKPTKKPLRRRN